MCSTILVVRQDFHGNCCNLNNLWRLGKMMVKEFKVDPELVKRCKEHYETASKELEEIEKVVQEYAASLGLEFAYYESAFEPFVMAEPGTLMRYPVIRVKNKRIVERGFISILEDGKLVFEKCEKSLPNPKLPADDIRHQEEPIRGPRARRFKG